MGARVRAMVIASLSLWVFAALAWVGLLVSEKGSGCPGFDISGGADASRASWQWLPPGMSCAYTLDGQTHVDDPPDARLAILGLLIAWPVGTVALAQASVLDQRECAHRAAMSNSS